MSRRRKLGFLAVALLAIALVIVVFTFLDPRALVETLGATGYLFIFLFAVIGGVSALTAGSFFATLAAFAVGGSSPWILAIVGGTGMILGDLIFYFVGRAGRDSFSGSWHTRIEKFGAWLAKQPPFLVGVVTYCYTAFTPFPGDVLSVALGLGGYNIWRVAIPMWLGNMTLLSLIAHFGVNVIG